MYANTFLLRYYSDAKNAEADIDRLMNNITALQRVFQQIQELVESPAGNKLNASKAVIESSALELTTEFDRLIKLLNPGTAQKAKKLLVRRRLRWPMQKEEVESTLQLLEHHKTTLIMAMNCDQM